MKTFLLIAAASLALLLPQVSAQETCAHFSILAAESINAEPGATIDLDLAVKNTGTCAGDTMVAIDAPGGWNANPALLMIPSLAPAGVHMETVKLSVPGDGQTSTVTLMADAADSLSIEVVIGNISSQNATEQAPGTAPEQTTPPVNVTTDLPIILPQVPVESPTTPIQEPAALPESGQPEPQAETSPAPHTGLATSNPAVYGAIFVVLLFGVIYLYESRRIHGYHYRN